MQQSKGWAHLQKFSISQALSHIFVGAVAGEPDSPPTFLFSLNESETAHEQESACILMC